MTKASAIQMIREFGYYFLVTDGLSGVIVTEMREKLD